MLFGAGRLAILFPNRSRSGDRMTLHARGHAMGRVDELLVKRIVLLVFDYFLKVKSRIAANAEFRLERLDLAQFVQVKQHVRNGQTGLEVVQDDIFEEPDACKQRNIETGGIRIRKLNIGTGNRIFGSGLLR